MAQSNHERMGKALEFLNAGVIPFFERDLRAHFGEDWQDKVVSASDERSLGRV